VKHLLADVAEFHRACGVPIHPLPIVPLHRVQLRRDLIREEFEETDTALQLCWLAKNESVALRLEQLADGLADLIYVAIGTALEFGIPLDRVWEAVQKSNMSKAEGCVRRADGKIEKGPNYKPPDIHAALWGEK
jgi:Uncharacterized protein conserved in bacteria